MCLLLYTKFNNKPNKIYAGFISFYESEPELVAASHYLSNVFYLIWLIQRCPKKCFEDINYFGKYALNLIYPYQCAWRNDSGYYTELYDKIPLGVPKLKEYYVKTLEKFKDAINNKKTTEVIKILRDDCLTYYLTNIQNVDKEKIQLYISKCYDIISLHLNKIFNNKEFQTYVMADNMKIVIYITIFTEFVLKLLIKENVQIMNPPNDFFVEVGGHNVVIPLLIKYNSEESCKVVARFGYDNNIKYNVTEINNIMEANNSLNEIFKLDTNNDILVKVLFNYKLNDIKYIREFQQKLSEEYNISISPYSVIPAFGRIIEYIEDGDLYNKLNKNYDLLTYRIKKGVLNPIKELSEFIETSLYYMKQYAELINRFIETYHSAGYVFFDWRLLNVGVNQNNKVVIVDSDLLNIEKIIKNEILLIPQTHGMHPTFNSTGPANAKEEIILAQEIFYRQLGNKEQVLQKDEFDKLVEEIKKGNNYEEIKYLIEYYKKYDNYIIFKDFVLNMFNIHFQINIIMDKLAVDSDRLFGNRDPFLSFCDDIYNEIHFDNIYGTEYNYLYLLGLYDILAKNDGENRFSDKNTIDVFNEIIAFIDNLIDFNKKIQSQCREGKISLPKKTTCKLMCDLINYFYIIPVKHCFNKGEINHAREIDENKCTMYSRKYDDEITIISIKDIEPKLI